MCLYSTAVHGTNCFPQSRHQQKSRQQHKALKSQLSSARPGNVSYSQKNVFFFFFLFPLHYFDINVQKAEDIILALPFATEIQPYGRLFCCGSHFLVYIVSQISNPKDESVFSKSCYSILLRCGNPKQGRLSPTAMKSILSTVTYLLLSFSTPDMPCFSILHP